VDRLQQHRLTLRQRFADADARCGPECKVGRIDAVIGTVGQRHVDVDDGKAKRPPLQSVDHALFDGADVVSWHRAANHPLVEFEGRAARHRLDFQHHVAELAMAARLLLVPATLDHRLADCLLVADRWRMRFDVDTEAVAQPF
jgi:hypothetical protein